MDNAKEQTNQSSTNDFGSFNALTVVDSRNECIDTFATMVDSPLATNDPLFARLNLEGVGSLKLEVDTAASHNIISAELFEKLQSRLLKNGREMSKVLPQGVKIKLADGSIAQQLCKVAQINVSRSMPEFKNPIPLTFLVVSGPNNLLGRHSLERLWPREFNAFKNVTSVGVDASNQPRLNHAGACVTNSVAEVSPRETVNKKQVKTCSGSQKSSNNNSVVINNSWKNKNVQNVSKTKGNNVQKSKTVSQRAPAGRSVQHSTPPPTPPSPHVAPAKPDAIQWPDRRVLRTFLEGEVTEEIGEAF